MGTDLLFCLPICIFFRAMKKRETALKLYPRKIKSFEKYFMRRIGFEELEIIC